MPEAFDLETQLRRYADHVEAQVGDVPPSSAPAPVGERRWPIYLAVAAALLLVVGLASTFGGDGDAEPADDDVIVSDPEPTSPTTPESTTTTSLPPPTTTPAISAEGLVLVPAVTQLFADTAMMTLRSEGLEPVIVFEPVEAGSSQVGRVISQSPAAFGEVEPGSVVTITVGEAQPEEWQPITDLAAHRAIDGFLIALAAEDWDAAAWYMNNGARSSQTLLDLGMPQDSGDEAQWIADWCEDALCGADYALAGVAREDKSVAMEVVFSSSTGPVTDFMRLTWFEGTVAVDALPPAGVVGQVLDSTMERLMPGFDGLATVVHRNHVTRIDAGTERIVPVSGTVDSSTGAVGGFVVDGSGPIWVLEPGSNEWWRQLSEAPFLGASRVHEPVVFTLVEPSTVRTIGLDGELVGSPFGLGGPSEALPLRYTVNREHSAALMSAGESTWLDIFEVVDGGYGPIAYHGQIALEGRGIGHAELAPNDSVLAAFVAPDVFAPYRSIIVLDFDGNILAEGPLPTHESFQGTIDFDGRWVVAPLESGRLFVVDAEADSARVVDVYAEVWFD